MKNILNRGFSELSLPDLIAKVMFIIAQLTGNAYFLTTAPTLAAVTAALKALTDAMALPSPQARDAAIISARATLEQMLDDLADNLELTANLDRVKLATTGFDMHKTATSIGDGPATPLNLRLFLTGISGAVKLMLDAVDRARGYEVQTTLDPIAGPWVTYKVFSSVRGIILDGFPRKQDLWVRARALGPNNTQSGWSDPVTILVA